MRGWFLGTATVCAIVACNGDNALPIGAADLTFEDMSPANVAWAIAQPAGWSLFFGGGSAETSCNDSSAYAVRADVWSGSAGSALPAGEYVVGCGSDAQCCSVDVADHAVEWAEVDLLEADDHHLRGSLQGSAASGSGAFEWFYGDFDAAACPSG